MTTDIIPNPSTKNLKKPDAEAFKKALEEQNKKIDALKKEQDIVKAKIDKLGKISNTQSRREELKASLNEIRDKQAEIKKNKQSVYVQLDALNASIKKKVANVKSFQAKVPFKSTEEVDDRIRELESQIERGVRLVEEKKILQEITTLKRGRPQVEDIREQQMAIDTEREIYNELRKNVDDGESKVLSETFDVLNAELKTLIDDGAKQYDKHNMVYNERNRLKALMDEAYKTIRTLRAEHNQANDAYYAAVREAREKRKEKERLEKLQHEAEKRQEAARQALELASLPAFEHEINLCDTLSVYLQSFINPKSNHPDTLATTNTAQQQHNIPEGFVVLKKKDNDEDSFYFTGNSKNAKKSGGANKTPKEKKSDALKLPLATMEDFFDIKVTVPTKISEIPNTLEKLRNRKAYYVAEQPKATEANKKKAQDKIAAMETENSANSKVESEVNAVTISL
ncbi:MAG: hypothetical protein EXX96DRAFT_558914 [Benjaminiella poitrasii]|nr:MAG: hypothetical protein EXX96DRAFT_558914 [Benjaminiella poitrasii]